MRNAMIDNNSYNFTLNMILCIFFYDITFTCIILIHEKELQFVIVTKTPGTVDRLCGSPGTIQTVR